MLKFIHNRRGVASLMEVLIASVIFLIAVFGVISSTAIMAPQTSDAMKRLKAAYIAKDVLDELRGKLTPESWDATYGSTDDELSIGTHTHPSPPAGFSVSWTIASAGTNVRTVTVNVTY